MTTRRHNSTLFTDQGTLQNSITTGAMAEHASESQTPPWIELPSGVWGLIGSNLGTRDFARASTVIKVFCGARPVALNLAHRLSDINKIGELMWGLKRSSMVLSFV
ncbi:g1581 [Coccomyxa elongata]